MYLLLNMMIFRCHVGFLEGNQNGDPLLPKISLSQSSRFCFNTVEAVIDILKHGAETSPSFAAILEISIKPLKLEIHTLEN